MVSTTKSHGFRKTTLEAFHTMAIDQVDKQFQQCDWSRAKVWPLDLYTKNWPPMDNAIQSAYMVALIVNFGNKSVPCGG
jgi:hypothetical protein